MTDATPQTPDPGRIAARASWSLALVGMGSLALVAALCDPAALDEGRRERSLLWLVFIDPPWLASVCALALLPLLYAAWRRSIIPFGRAIGVALSLVAAASVWMCVLSEEGLTWRHMTYVPLIAAAVAYSVAFRVAPDPRDPETIDALAARRLLRSHRKSA